MLCSADLIHSTDGTHRRDNCSGNHRFSLAALTLLASDAANALTFAAD
jgi:hypothetical protein